MNNHADDLELNADKLRIGVVGFGKMGMLHAGILNVLPKVQLVAVCERNSLIRKVLKKVLKNVCIVDDVEKLSALDLDAVYVTTPIGSHFPVVKSVFEGGFACNVFVEKTLASNFDEARRLCELADKYGGVNMVGYMRRFCVTFMKARELLDQGAIGEPTSFKAYAFSSDFFGVDKNSKVQTPKIDVLRDLGCHALDLALWFFGGLKVENARIESIINDGSMDSAQFGVKASDSIAGEFKVSWCMDGHRMPEVGFTIQGSKGSLNFNDDVLELNLKDGCSRRWFRHDIGDNVAFWLGNPEYYREDECFVKAILNQKKAEPCFETAAKVDGLIDEVLARADQRE